MAITAEIRNAITAEADVLAVALDACSLEWSTMRIKTREAGNQIKSGHQIFYYLVPALLYVPLRLLLEKCFFHICRLMSDVLDIIDRVALVTPPRFVL